MKFYQLIPYLKFIASASNQHGVHSPFVYGYVTKCLYKKEKLSASKSINVFLKSISYFKVKNIKITSETRQLKNTISNTFPNLLFNSDNIDALYVHQLEKNTASTYITNNKSLHNNSFAFINNIQRDLILWKKLIQLKEITVSINLFYCGIVFFRKEQGKEHFKIRL